MARKYRPRKEFKFWLYHDLHEDIRLMEFIQYCKATRQFARVVRDGIRLIWSLRDGNTEVLFELFPHLQRQFKPDAEELIEQFRQMLMQYSTAPVQQPVQAESHVGQGGPKALNAPQFALPIPDDDEDEGETLLIHTSHASGDISAMMSKVYEMMQVKE